MKPKDRAERSPEDCGTFTATRQPISFLRTINCAGTLLLVSSLSIGMNAQSQPQSPYTDNTQNPATLNQYNPNAPDCSDSTQSLSPACSEQNPSATSLQNPQARNPQLPRYAPQTGAQTGNYNDIEQLSRPGTAAVQPPLPPEPLTEFQKFVASSTGQVLPIFGANLFRRVPSTFAPVDLAPVPPDFVIGPGDELRIRVWGQLSFQANVRVDRSGEVYLPQVGPIHVANVPFSALDGQLRKAIGRVFRNFDLTVDLGQIRSIQVYLAGSARRPGVYTVSSLSTLVDALFAGGGPNTQGSLRRIELRRGSEKVTEYDLYDLLVHGDKSKDVKLLPGDVIFIPPVGSQMAVNGSVRTPGIYELLPNETLAQALANAGGASAIASAARVSIERIEDRHSRHAMEVPYDETGLKTPVADGDLVRVYSIVPQYADTVTLRGNIANPGRFAWHPGMHISNLIPDKESLITRNYWWKRVQLGLPAPEFEPTPGFQDMRQPIDNNAVTLKPPTLPDDMSQSDSQQGGAPPAGWQQSGPQQYGPQQNGPQQNQYLTPEQRGTSSSLGGAEQTATSSLVPRAAQRTQIRLLAPEIVWDYATIERIDPETLKTTLVPFDLGKLVIQHDVTQDLELKSGDIVSIFSEADIRVPLAAQTKLVTLDGEFVHAGVYTVEPNETLRHLVARAGGITPKAYLYGSEFTRESVRTVQQARIDEYVRTLELSLQRATLALAAASTQDQPSGASAQASGRDLVSALRQVRATGRIVLAFKPENNDLQSIPDVALENGDRFVLPHVPAVVNVVGAVYNQNSFLYSDGRTTSAYLFQAGGPSRDADAKHTFVIRANGDVVSRDSKKGVWGDDFAKLHLNPGDSIVVPNKTFKPSAIRGALEWTQLASQLAFAAAAINSIK
jgi:protein involved in polysaccharide export with SLBB domain